MLRHEEYGKNSYAESYEDLLKGLDLGQSIHIRNVERLLPTDHPLVSLFFDIEHCGYYMADSISCFVSPPNSKAISIHHDENDIFTYQLQGSKSWEIYNRTVSDMPRTYTAEEVDKQTEFVAKAGDFFFLPKGMIHNVGTQNEMSVSVAFVYNPVTYKMVFRKLIDEFLSFHEIAAENLGGQQQPEEFMEMNQKLQQFLSITRHDDATFLINKILTEGKMKRNSDKDLINKVYG